VGDRRQDFTSASCEQLCEKRRDNLTAYIGEGVAVEEEKRGLAVAVPQEFRQVLQQVQPKFQCS